jgi:exopolyphosphatase/guanosine-5'-triphosphate,3'-diphosphate pyrophosphatase
MRFPLLNKFYWADIVFRLKLCAWSKIMENMRCTKVLVEFGSNAVKVLAASKSDPHEYVSYRFPLRLAAELDSMGNLRPAAINDILKSIQKVKHQFPHAKEIRLVGTSALRRAKNSEDIANEILKKHKLKLKILSEEEEALAVYYGVKDLIPAGKRAVCFDVGGGSTEIVRVWGKRLERVHSFPLGAVRLSASHINKYPLSNCDMMRLEQDIEKALRFNSPKSCNVIGTGGAVHTCAMVALSNKKVQTDDINGFRLFRSELIRQLESFRNKRVSAIAKVPGMDPARADIIIPAILIMIKILDKTGQPYLIATDRGVRHGIWNQ